MARRSVRRVRAVALLLLVLVAPQTALADPNPIRAQIASPSEGDVVADEPVELVDGTTTSPECPIVEWEWKLGDGRKIREQHATVTYPEPGEFELSLHVRGSCGHRHGTSLLLVVSPASDAPAPAAEPAAAPSTVDAAPTARLAVPDRVRAGDGFALDGSGSDDVGSDDLTYLFSLDNASFPERASPTLDVVVLEAGVHEARLVVRDGAGRESAPAVATFEVVPSHLASLRLVGPPAVTAGTTAIFEVLGEDAYGNAVPVAAPSFTYTAPAQVGVAEVCHEEQGLRACAAIEVVPPRVARVSVAGPALVNVDRSVPLRAVAYDAYGAVLDVPVSWATTLGTVGADGAFVSERPGTARVTATAGDAASTLEVQVSSALSVAIRILERSRTATVTVRYADGSPAAGAEVLGEMEHVLVDLTVLRSTVQGTVPSSGRLLLDLGDEWTLPGEHTLHATARIRGNSGDEKAHQTRSVDVLR